VTTGGGTRTVLVPVRDPVSGKVVMVATDRLRPATASSWLPGRVVTITVYEKYMRITARETPEESGIARRAKSGASTFRTRREQRLARVCPLMVSAAMDSINQNSAAQKEVVLNKGDERVTFVKQGM